jgi:2-keto-4-pentenoate hydratase/2-oxohepta-3-ene-1,7-dioic acid hydratase in catechol pathway
MRLATIKLNGEETAALAVTGGAAPISGINAELGCDWETDLLTLIKRNRIKEMTAWHKEAGEEKLASLKSVIPSGKVFYGPLYRNPDKIFGIGLNYKDHAGDLAENAPTGIPGSFFKPATTIIGCGDEIKIPVQSDKTTGEAELGVIMGAECEDIEPENWLEYVAGFTAVIDMTAEDILRLNPRYLTYAKSFETFFSFGPHLVTPDEVRDVKTLVVRTVRNGEIHAQNTVSNMTFPPDFLVSFHSKAFKWSPGDILSTGTPRAAHIQHGDTIECRIDGFEPLINGVVDRKAGPCPA